MKFSMEMKQFSTGKIRGSAEDEFLYHPFQATDPSVVEKVEIHRDSEVLSIGRTPKSGIWMKGR
jgi:hypothetical protein